MEDNSIIVLAIAKAKNGNETELEKLTKALVEPTRAEQACIQYDLHISDDKKSFMFYEIWTNKEALDEHITTPHLQNFLEKTKDILAEPLDVSLWQKIS
jgi:quinol monooxygenase YgiN